MKTKNTLIFSFLMFIMIVFNPINSRGQGYGEYHSFNIFIGDTLSRYYLLYEPMGYTPGEAWPVVFAFHGFGENTMHLAESIEMYMVADTADFFIVYPFGLPTEDLIVPNNTKVGWHVPGGYTSPYDDVEYVSCIIDDIIGNPDYTIDTNRIFATGVSNGSEFTFYLACTLNDRIASFAGISAPLAYGIMDSVCNPGRSVSILHSQGTDDPVFPAGGNWWCPTLEATSEYWAGIDHCNLEPTITSLPDLDPGDSCTVSLLAYDSCYKGYEVLCYRIEGGVHVWPGGQNAGSPGNNNDIHTSSEIWKFFLRNPHPRTYDFCLPDGVTFANQQQIDDFQVYYPNCHDIEGDVIIKGNDITDLNGLNSIINIGGNLSIYSNDALTSLSGLNSIANIGGNLSIFSNDALTSLGGLNSLLTIGGDLEIGRDRSPMATLHNISLEELSGLENLTSIGGSLHVVYNDVLSSLEGLDQIEAQSIEDLHIYENPLLSSCEVQSICDYLAAPSGMVDIHDNATGCNDSTQVSDICLGVWVDEYGWRRNLSISPNPSSGVVHLRYTKHGTRNTNNETRITKIELYSLQGIKVRTLLNEVQQPGEYEMVFDISELPAGMYFVRMQLGERVETVKMVKAGSYR